jgi:Mycothiol maleylpyruvate isomerase N-terminal domain
MSERDDNLAALDEGYDEFRMLLGGIPQDAYDETWMGDWGARHLLAHLSGWFREMAGSFERLGRGERPGREGIDMNDADGVNANFVETLPPATEALADFDGAFKAFRDAAAALDEGLFGMDEAKGRLRIGSRLLETAGAGHFEEHVGELREWLHSRR